MKTLALILCKELYMNNNKRNVHNSGALGMLLKQGQVKKVDENPENSSIKEKRVPPSGSYFKTKTGIEFGEHELLFLDPKECEPWCYANRQEAEMGNLDSLINSIKKNKQLQPALVRKHPAAHDGIQYEIIFGRRRHAACTKLGIPFLVILKDIPNVQDAIASQDAENKQRNDVSNYSNALLYKTLLDNKVFQTGKELAAKLSIPLSSLSEIMAFSRIPQDIVDNIPDMHDLSINFAIKILALCNQSNKHQRVLIDLAPKIGKEISSPDRLQKVVDTKLDGTKKVISDKSSKQYKSSSGKKLFTLKYDNKGAPCIIFNSDSVKHIDMNKFCNSLTVTLEEQ